MDFPQTHHTNTGRAFEVDREPDGTLTFTDGGTQLATLAPAGDDAWRLTLPGGLTRELLAREGDPPITASIVQIDLHEDEDDDTSGVDD